MLRITAIIAAKNELPYLKNLIPYLDSENIDVVVVDNESTDGTEEYVNLHHPKTRIEHLPYKGSFDLTEVLLTKQKISQSLASGWVIHHDADEIMVDKTGWGGLRSSIEKSDHQGFNAMNFQELVLLPRDPEVDDVLNNNKNFYYFGPHPIRKQATYKLGLGIENVTKAGHWLTGDIKLSDELMFVRHYLVRSQSHAITKFANRQFSRAGLNKGWHSNRTNLSGKALKIPTEHPNLAPLPDPFDADLVLRHPLSDHFWAW